jgi:hypothetical protein
MDGWSYDPNGTSLRLALPALLVHLSAPRNP